MNDELFESLLYEDEGASLDFKREQYPFAGASREKKSELLKDLLAMANAWRTGPAHILIGVEEVRGGKSKVVGESDHPGEHSLQQFVNSKTNRPVEFSYRVYKYEGKKVGIFRIPLQERPLYLEKDYGKVEAEAVYLRRGSATEKATPDEIARMRVESPGGQGEPPKLDLQWADLDAREKLGSEASIRQVRLDPRLDPEVLKRELAGSVGVGVSYSLKNENYYEELVEFAHDDTWLTAQGFFLKHAGGPAARKVELVAEIERQEGLILLDSSEAPEEPSWFRMLDVGPFSAGVTSERVIEVEEHPNHWTVTVPFGDLSPRREVWSETSLYIGATESTSVEFTGRLYAENLREPIEVGLELSVEVETRKMEWEDLRPHLES